MQRLGRVINVTSSKNIIVKIDQPPRIGTSVVDENLKLVGKIFDIIGPVSSPYALVKSTIKTPEKIAKNLLYTLPIKNRRRK
ncbi:H/ACA RNA-protein complex protein Gar1, partial [Candidatus Bathyarchaeota archaeon]|nr:H/ACA RNA-protein complex protein Gar1 [Candidatus Bathyarchaeota archaeon]